MNPSPPVICNPCDATAQSLIYLQLEPRFIAWKTTQKLATFRLTAMRFAAVGSNRARPVSYTHLTLPTKA